MATNAIRYLCAAAAAFSSHAAIGAVFGPVVRTIADSEWNTSGYTPVPTVPPFNPALGTLRCREVIVGQSWFASGELCVIRIPSGGGGTVSGTVQSGVTLGYFDATGFTSLATDVDVGASVSLNFPGGSGIYCGATYGGAGSHATRKVFLTSQDFPGGMYASGGAGLGLNFPFPPGGHPFIKNATSSTDATFTFFWHYTPIHPCPGDVNGDGVIDFLDLNGVLGTFTETGPCAMGDVNNDNVVDFLDLNEVLSFFGLACR